MGWRRTQSTGVGLILPGPYRGPLYYISDRDHVKYGNRECYASHHRKSSRRK